MKRLITVLLLLSSFVFANEFSWKTFDVKVSPYLASYSNDFGATGVGIGLQVVKPFSPYVGAGQFYEIAVARTFSTDCNQYRFDDFSGGILLNLNAPISRYFNLSSNYMFGIT